MPVILAREEAFKRGYNTRQEAYAAKRSGDRVYYDESVGKYYIKRINNPFWGR